MTICQPNSYYTKLMEIGEELENAGKCVLYTMSIGMESRYFMKYLGNRSSTNLENTHFLRE